MTDSAFVGNDLLDGKQPQNMTGARIPLGGTGGALPVSDDDGLPPGLKEDYTQAQRGTFKHLLDVDAQTEARMERDRARIEHQYEAEGVGPGEFQKWDAGAESKKYQTDPIQAFGSLGSVFGMLASAFTRAPMENALNASAAAMNAVRAGDEEAYNRAHDAWKENTDLTFKRHQLEHERLGDALRLMDTDMAAGAAKARMVAAQFGMSKEMVLIEHGMFPELYEAMEKRADAINKTGQAVQEITGRGLQKLVFERDAKTIEEHIQDPTQKGQALLDAFNNAFFLHMKPGDPRAQALGQFAAETIKGKGRLPTADELIAKNKEITEALTRPYLGGAGSGGNVNLTDERQRADAVRKIMEEKRQSGELEGKSQEDIARIREDVSRQLKTEGAAISGKTKDDLAGQIERLQLSDQTIDKVEALLKKHNALVGLGGRITRPAEVVGNVFGSNATDRAQFASYISELREWGPRLLNESKGRPLAAEEAEIARIIPGLSAGDTTANTAKRLLRLQELFRTMREQSTRRYEGVFDPRDAGAPRAPRETVPAGGTGDEKMPWDAAPIKTPADKRSSNESPFGKIASFFNPVGTAQAEELPPAQSERAGEAGGFFSQPISSQNAEVRAYEPTWRDRLANFLLPDKASYHTRQMARETIGSSGIGTTGVGGSGISALDLTPVGAALSAQESIQADNPSEAGAHAMSAAIPVGGAAVRAGMPLARPMVRQLMTTLLGAGAGAGTTLAASRAEAGDEGLTAEQKEILRRSPRADRPALLQSFAKEAGERRAQTEKETRERQVEQEREGREKEERAKHDEEARTKLEAEVSSLPEDERALYRGFNAEQRTKFWADKAERKHQADEKEAAEYKARTAAFRDRYPVLNSMLPWIGTSLSAAIPYAVKLRQASAANKYIKKWEETAEKAEKALAAGDKTAATPLVNTLKEYNKEHAEILKTLADKGHSPVTIAAAATLPFDASFVVPNAYDATVLPRGAEAQKQGWENLTNPSEYGSRLPSSILEGLPPAVTSTKIPVPGRTVPPTARSKGLVASARTPRKRAASPKQTLPELVRDEDEELPPGLKPKRKRASRTASDE
jgi:hypothetical protein